MVLPINQKVLRITIKVFQKCSLLTIKTKTRIWTVNILELSQKLQQITLSINNSYKILQLSIIPLLQLISQPHPLILREQDLTKKIQHNK